jgi:hypothetical protein
MSKPAVDEAGFFLRRIQNPTANRMTAKSGSSVVPTPILCDVISLRIEEVIQGPFNAKSIVAERVRVQRKTEISRVGYGGFRLQRVLGPLLL